LSARLRIASKSRSRAASLVGAYNSTRLPSTKSRARQPLPRREMEPAPLGWRGRFRSVAGLLRLLAISCPFPLSDSARGAKSEHWGHRWGHKRRNRPTESRFQIQMLEATTGFAPVMWVLHFTREVTSASVDVRRESTTGI
jgi:hypothetical protein